ncbi:hypothetical protein RR48_10353 [Papilio machaon]|uniref:Uncharacterized protein n=1 Tax=Papilio machaon TaxID=76193 RepID=A0A194RH37_PAPMA|nr:hypothetical protein RR48_10353 [Papilio machaon]
MKLSCALVLTLTNLVIATPYSFSVKGSGASAKAEAATSPYGQFGVVKPVASKTSGFSGTFSKSSSSSLAPSSASSSSSAYNYNAGQIGTASLGYGSQGFFVPNKNVVPQVVTVPQATAFATAGSNSQTGASVNAQATGSYSSEKGNSFSGNANSPANVQYQSAVPENKPNSYVALSSGIPSHWQEQLKPNSFNTNVPEKPKEAFGVQSFSSDVQSGTAVFSTPSAPSKESALVENAPSYSGGFGGPPGILSPHDKISSVGGNTPGQYTIVSYTPGATVNVPSKQQTLPVSTVNPLYAQHGYQIENTNPTVQSINNEYVFQTENSKPLYKPDIKPTYSDQNKQTASGSYNSASSEWQHDGQHVTLQPHAEIVQTTPKELEQASHSTGQFSSHSEKPLAINNDSKPIKNVQIFIQPIPSNAPQTVSKPVYFTNTQVGSENKKEVKPVYQLSYTGGFGAPAGVLKPSGQTVSSGQTFSSSPVKIEQFESSAEKLTGTKETTLNTDFGGSLNEVKETAQPSSQSTNDHSFDSGSSSATYVTPKPSTSSLFTSSPTEKVSYDYVSTEQKGTDQFTGKPSESSYPNPTVSSWAQNPTVNSLPIRPEFELQKKPTDKTKPTTLSGSFGQVPDDVKPTIQSTINNNGFAYSNKPYKPVVTPTTPYFEATKQKESSFAYSTTQPTPVNSWQQSTYKPSIDGSTPGYFDKQETSPTKYPSLTGYNTVSKQSEQYPSGTYSTVGSTTDDIQVTSNLNQQSSGYGSTVTQEPTAQVSSAGPTLTSFSQEASYKPSFENSLAVSSIPQLSESPKTSSPQTSSTGAFTVSKEVYKVPTQVVSNAVYPPGSVSSVFHLIPNSETSQFHANSHNQHQQSTNYGDATSFVTQKPTKVNFVGQSPGATSGPTSAYFPQQPNKPIVASSLTTSSVSGSYINSDVSPTQKPFFTYNLPKETEVIPSDTSSNIDSTVGTAFEFNSNAYSGKPQTQFNISQQSVEYKPTSFVTQKPTASVNLASQTFSTPAISQSTTFSQQSPKKPSDDKSEGTSPSKNPQYLIYTKPTTETRPQKQSNVYSNAFGTLTGAVKPSSYSSPSSTGYPGWSSNSWSGPSYLTGFNDKPQQTNYLNPNKPTVSSLPEKKEQVIPTNPTEKPSLPVASTTVVQQSSSSITNQKEIEPTATPASGSGTTYSKPTSQPIVSNSEVSYTSFASPKPTKPTNQFSTSNPPVSTFGSSTFSQVKPQYQFSTIQPVTQKKQWYTNNYGTFGAVKPHSYPGFTSSFTTFGQGSVGGLYDKTKQTTQYSSTGQYKPTSTGQYNPSLTGQYNPVSTGQYKPTYNWGIAGQSQFQKPSYQPTQTGGSYVSTYTQTTGKPFVTLSSLDKQKVSGGAPVVNQKVPSISSSFASSTGIAKPTNQPSALYASQKPTSSGTLFESSTGNPSVTNVSDKEKVTSSIVSTTSKYDAQKPVNPTVQTVSNTYVTSSFISAKPTANFQTTGTPLLENKPTYTYTVQQQSVPSEQTVAPTKDVEVGQSIKPVWSYSNQKDSSYTSTTEVATSNLNPTTQSVDGSDNSQFVDKTQASPVRPTSSVNFVGQKPLNPFNGQVGLTNQTPSPGAQNNPSYQQSSEPFSSASSSGSATSQFSQIPSTAYFNSKPDKVQYTFENVQSAYKPTSVAGSITSFANQQNTKPPITAPSQENYSNEAEAGPTKPPGQYWTLNSQSEPQQTTFQTTKPNIKITVVGKPNSNIVSPTYSGGFGGPSGILKPNEFGISSNPGNTQSQFQAASGAYTGAKVDTDSITASYSGGFGASSGLLKPDEKYSIQHVGHNNPSSNGFHAGTSQGGAQTSYVEPTFSASGAYENIKEQTGYGAQVSSEVQGTSVTNVEPSTTTNSEVNSATNAAANGFANNNAYASSSGAVNTGTTFSGQSGRINGFSANAKGSATASATSSGSGGSITTFNRPLSTFTGSPGDIARRK